MQPLGVPRQVKNTSYSKQLYIAQGQVCASAQICSNPQDAHVLSPHQGDCCPKNLGALASSSERTQGIRTPCQLHREQSLDLKQQWSRMKNLIAPWRWTRSMQTLLYITHSPCTRKLQYKRCHLHNTEQW